MKTKPWIFQLLALINLFLIFWIPMQVMWVTGMKNVELAHLMKFLNTTNVTLMGLFCMCFFYIRKLNRLTPVILIATTLLVIFNNQLAQVNNPFPTWYFDLASIAYLALILPAFLGSNYRAMVDRNFQWWKTDPRVHAKLKVQIFSHGDSITCQSVDVSKSGIFLQQVFQECNEGEEITMEIEFEHGQKVFCRAEVMRKCEARGLYPKGIGFKFTNKPYFFEKYLNKFITQKNIA